ncbi:MAG: DNA repair protein RecN [Solirubrobacterales bacterium]
MLIELRIENLLLIERAELALGDGLNVITGETGAGKTVLAHAIDLLLGGKSRRGIVRPGAGEAYVEGLFAVPEGLLARAEFSELRERLSDPDATELALGRRVTPEGRTRAYIEGRSATAADLQLLGGALVSFYGQHEHRKLTLAGAQLATLDGYCVGDHRARVAEAAALHSEANALQAQLAEFELLDGRRERELGLIEFELAEIDELAPDPDEEVALGNERARLKSVDALRSATDGALLALDDEESGGAVSLVAGAAGQLQAAAVDTAVGSDPALGSLASRVEALLLELQDVAGELRGFAGGLSDDPERLAILDDRLDGYERLKRKHGGSVEAVLVHAERCREDRERLAGSQDQIERAGDQLVDVRSRQQALAAKITKARGKAAPALAAAVREGLAELALAEASFEIEIATAEGDPGPTGADAVEFMIAPNPGIAAAPLRETASGGELSRVMLALLTASGAGGDQTFVFDEIDAGIGGHTARAVGEQLRALGEARQVICITHLPQVAAAAERHFQIEKSSDGSEARTDVSQLDDKAVVTELCRMLGADADDAAARKHARQLIAGSLPIAA